MWNPLKKKQTSPQLQDDFDISLLACPRCVSGVLSNETDESRLTCGGCSAEYPIVDGIPILLKDPEAHTKLDEAEYHAGHQINEQRCTSLYKQWARVFDRFGVQGGNLLEIGCGSGYLTYGLVNSSRFDQVHSIDISPKFIGASRQLTSSLERQALYYACDANYLPFKEGQFNAIVGNSVLHHFLDYQNTLKQCQRILKPGGVAIFFEPVVQGKSIIAFMIDMLSRMDKEFSMNVFSAQEHAKMKQIVVHQTTIPKLKNDRQRLANTEDKYIFDLEEFAVLAREIGFSEFDRLSANDQIPRDFKQGVINTLGYFGIKKEQVERFDFLFESFLTTYSDILGESVVSPMVFSVFKR